MLLFEIAIPVRVVVQAALQPVQTFYDTLASPRYGGRLLEVAFQETGQSRRVADFLLAWHNAAENGGWPLSR